VVDNLDIEKIRARLHAFLVAVIDGKGPKAVARDLTALGYAYTEGAVRAWRGERKPPAEILFALSAMYESSMDQFALGEALERSLEDRLREQDERLARLEGRLRGWEIEWASAAGQEPPAELVAGAISLDAARWQRRMADLEKQVRELREQQA
jgi:hypothetical protein